MMIFSASFLATLYKPMAAGTAISAVFLFAMEEGSPSKVSLVLTALLMSVLLRALGMLWKVSERVRKIIEFAADKWFDGIERKVGMKPSDFDEVNIPTPMDEYTKATKPPEEGTNDDE